MTNKNACTTLHKRCCPPPNLAITRKWHRLTKTLGYSGSRASPSSPLHSHSAKPRNSTITTRMRQNASKCYRFSENFRIDRFSRFPFRPPLDHSAKPPQLRACLQEPSGLITVPVMATKIASVLPLSVIPAKAGIHPPAISHLRTDSPIPFSSSVVSVATDMGDCYKNMPSQPVVGATLVVARPRCKRPSPI